MTHPQVLTQCTLHSLPHPAHKAAQQLIYSYISCLYDNTPAGAGPLHPAVRPAFPHPARTEAQLLIGIQYMSCLVFHDTPAGAGPEHPAVRPALPHPAIQPLSCRWWPRIEPQHHSSSSSSRCRAYTGTPPWCRSCGVFFLSSGFTIGQLIF